MPFCLWIVRQGRGKEQKIPSSSAYAALLTTIMLLTREKAIKEREKKWIWSTRLLSPPLCLSSYLSGLVGTEDNKALHPTHLHPLRTQMEKWTECWRHGGGVTVTFQLLRRVRRKGAGLREGYCMNKCAEDRRYDVIRATRDLSKSRRHRPWQ